MINTLEMSTSEIGREFPTLTPTQINSLIDQLHTWDDDRSEFEDTCEWIQRSIPHRSMKKENLRRKKVSDRAKFSCRGIDHRSWIGDNQLYGQIVKALGACTFEVNCFDHNRTYIGKLRGLMIRKVWVKLGDIVLFSTRDFDSNRVDIIRTHTLDEGQHLRKLGTIPRTVKLGDEFLNSLYFGGTVPEADLQEEDGDTDEEETH